MRSAKRGLPGFAVGEDDLGFAHDIKLAGVGIAARERAQHGSLGGAAIASTEDDGLDDMSFLFFHGIEEAEPGGREERSGVGLLFGRGFNARARA